MPIWSTLAGAGSAMRCCSSTSTGSKKVNDSFGHAVGDKLLCRTAERLQRVLPTDAFLARLGGDEFAIALPRPERAEAVTR